MSSKVTRILAEKRTYKVGWLCLFLLNYIEVKTAIFLTKTTAFLSRFKGQLTALISAY